MNALAKIKGIFGGADLLGKIGAGFVLGAIVMLFVKGCGETKFLPGSAIVHYLPGDTIRIHDTVKTPIYPKKTGENSFSYHFMDSSGLFGFDAHSALDAPLDNIIFHYSKQVDTLRIDSLIYVEKGDELVRSGAEVYAGMSPVLDQTFKIGVKATLGFQNWRIATGPEIEWRPGYLAKHINVEVAYRFLR